MSSHPTTTTEDACDLRFGQVGLVCLRVHRADAAALCDELERRVRSAPKLFSRAAVVLDLSYLPKLPDDGSVDALLEAIRSVGLIPTGLAYGTRATEALAMRMGLPLISGFRAIQASTDAPPTTSATKPPSVPRATHPTTPPTGINPQTMHTLHHDGAVRSGQQIYARDCDLVVTGNVANGAEVIADGDIHIYGVLRGRAMAGAQGHTEARLFVSDFHAELVAIAGHYRVFEKIPGNLDGRSVHGMLENEKLRITRL